MEELTEDQKQRMAHSLELLSQRLDEMKHLCTTDMQRKLFIAIEEFVDSFRDDDTEE